MKLLIYNKLRNSLSKMYCLYTKFKIIVIKKCLGHYLNEIIKNCLLLENATQSLPTWTNLYPDFSTKDLTEIWSLTSNISNEFGTIEQTSKNLSFIDVNEKRSDIESMAIFWVTSNFSNLDLRRSYWNILWFTL